ncbi:hypothetical protein P280DRAFT_515365 [Massarina eburnea CBS 473.64]|uniref:F-box domain-containing protein n=1 Tax=Massarina eburnea CBS 473.64 TaxID=1395130 RepID=A0A6A6S4T1_9PLEO|nr:hypothetical protein P280DRAFT_515365 [Massarina eburnea CBS 473.64]
MHTNTTLRRASSYQAPRRRSPPDLPPEIRNHIYAYATEKAYQTPDSLLPTLARRNKPLHAIRKQPKPGQSQLRQWLGLAQTSRQLRSEYLPLWQRRAEIGLRSPDLAPFMETFYPEVMAITSGATTATATDSEPETETERLTGIGSGSEDTSAPTANPEVNGPQLLQICLESYKTLNILPLLKLRATSPHTNIVFQPPTGSAQRHDTKYIDSLNKFFATIDTCWLDDAMANKILTVDLEVWGYYIMLCTLKFVYRNEEDMVVREGLGRAFVARSLVMVICADSESVEKT